MTIHFNKFFPRHILISLILSLPPTSVSVERSFSALKRIKTFSRNTIGQNRLKNLSLIAIEKDFVKQLQEQSNFYDKVIDIFATTKERRIDLIYKNV